MSRRGGRTPSCGYVPSSEALPWPLSGPRVPPRGDAAVPCPAGPPPSPPVTGAGIIADPPEVNTPARCCSPPPAPAGTVVLPPTPWGAPRDGGCSNAAPPCAPCMTCMPGPCAHRTGSAWGAAAAPPFFPLPAAPSSAPEEESATPGGRPVPTPGAGTPARATVSWREMFPKMSASPWEEEGGEVKGGEGDVRPLPPYCGRPGYLPAPVAPAAAPLLPPPALALSPGGVRGGGAARAAGAPPAHPTYPSRSGCVPPPSRREGGGRKVPPGGARTRATPGALVASRRSLR